MRRKLLYFYTAPSSFVKKDLDILSQEYDVRTFLFSMTSKRSWPLTIIRQKLFLLRHLFSDCIVLCMFGGMHSVLPVMFARICSRKSAIVAGGTDCVSFPGIRYGNFASAFNARCTSYSFRKCSLILPVHRSLVYSDYSYMDSAPAKQGIKAFVTDLKTPIRVVHNGYDPSIWSNKGKSKIPFSFITIIAYSNSRFTEKLKGLDLFKSLAAALPHGKFHIVGPAVKNDLPANIQVHSNLAPSKLADLLADKQFYLQLSISEGFPNALSEAMLCECVPVVSAVGGMPDIVQNYGLIIQRRDVQLLIEEVKRLIDREDLAALGEKARSRILNNFPLEKRQRELISALNEM